MGASEALSEVCVGSVSSVRYVGLCNVCVCVAWVMWCVFVTVG